MAADAFLVPTLDQEVIDNFNCLQTTGDFCDMRRVELEPFVQKMPRLKNADFAKDRFGNRIRKWNPNNWPDDMPFSNAMPEDDTGGQWIDGERIYSEDRPAREHQLFDEFFPEKYYEVHVRLTPWKFHPDLAPSMVYSYSDMSPGPLYKARYGEPIVVRQYNDLNVNGDGTGFGRPETITHLHNGHTASESDGFPGDFYPGVGAPGSPGQLTMDPGADGQMGTADDLEIGTQHPGADYIWGTEDDYLTGQFGQYHDHHYPNVLAGFRDDPRWAHVVHNGMEPPADLGDPNEALNTLWYHDHRGDFTAQSTYKGLVGMYILYDDVDSGNEWDWDPDALRLPSGRFDVPMLFADKSFDDSPDHQLFMNIFNFDGFLGNHVTVNGAVKPFMRVRRRKYRFRMLNAGPSRFYNFKLYNATTGEEVPMTMIANDGNLLPHPTDMDDGVEIAPAERMDVVVDFRQFRRGDRVYLVNAADQWHGAGPTGINLDAAESDRVVEFRVGRWRFDPSRVPNTLRERTDIEEDEIERERVFEFDNQSDGWTINGKQFDAFRVDEEVQIGSTERWILRNTAADWEHPVHIHMEEHQIVSRDGEAPGPDEAGRKDVTVIGPQEEVVVRIKIRDWTGRYPLHCHNTVHEDHAMLIRWDIVGEPPVPPVPGADDDGQGDDNDNGEGETDDEGDETCQDDDNDRGWHRWWRHENDDDDDC